MRKIKLLLAKFLRSKGRRSFIAGLPENAHILDVGCGNAAVLGVKAVRPNCHYTGIDIADYNQTSFSKSAMDRYVISSPSKFAASIKELGADFDGIISSHNLEHCDDRNEVLTAMLQKVKSGGVIYVSFPCEESVRFPKRHGTLNYYDDDTHKFLPPKFEEVVSSIKKNGFEIEFVTKRYRPFLLAVIGFLIEPISALRKKVMRGTWELYGFETIIHARRKR